MLASLAAAVVLAPSYVGFYSHGPFNPAVPTPDRVLGYPLGSRHTVFRDQERVLQAIAGAAQDRVRTWEFGRSSQGRPLRLFAFSSPANLRRLEQIRQANVRLANPGPNDDVAALVKNAPAIVWVNQVIHGDETAAFESAMALAYTLAATRRPDLLRALDDAVVLLNPVYNPDGHERFVVWNNSVAVGTDADGAYEGQPPTSARGRQNHYRFDMNRDRVAMSQDETRAEAAEFLRWFPHVYVDQHGQTDNYFFPPNPMSINPNVDRDRLNKWADVFGRATAQDFDQRGWTYFIKSIFDFYYAGYLDTWTTLSGAIGMTHETDGGFRLALKRDDGTTLTVAAGAEKHLVSALAVIRASAERRSDLVNSFASFRRRAATGESAGDFQRVIVESDDWEPLRRLHDHLLRSGIRAFVPAKPWRQEDGTSYWTGKPEPRTFGERPTLVIDLDQGQGALAKALLDPRADFEKEFVERQLKIARGEGLPGETPEFYDYTGWALPLAYSLPAWWAKSRPAVAEAPLPAPKGAEALGIPSKPVAYAFTGGTWAERLAVLDALAAGLRGRVSERPLRLPQGTLPAGTVLFLAARNDDGYAAKLLALARARGARAVPVLTSYPAEGADGPGSEGITSPLRKPRIGVVFGAPGQLGSVSGIWFLLERELKVPFVPLTTNLPRDLDSYSALIVPQGTGLAASPRLREWIQNGGCLIALGGMDWALGSGGFANLERTNAEPVPGALFRAKLDDHTFLGFGYPSREVAVPTDGGTFYKGEGVVTFPNEPDVPNLLSGWAWPDNTEKNLRGTVWATVAPIGRGHFVGFAEDPTGRMMWPGLWRMLLNAIVFGPRP